MKIRKVYEELLKQEKRTILRLKCLSGATAFIFFALFLWAFLGLNVVRKVAKGFKFERGNCVVENSTTTGQNVSCECGMHACVSRYPCLKVWVRITERAEKTEPLKLVLLHNNIYDLGVQVSLAQNIIFLTYKGASKMCFRLSVTNGYMLAWILRNLRQYITSLHPGGILKYFSLRASVIISKMATMR